MIQGFVARGAFMLRDVDGIPVVEVQGEIDLFSLAAQVRYDRERT